jgi:hypothetical protein
MITFNISAGPLLRYGPVANLVIEARDEADARRLAKTKIPSGWHVWRASKASPSVFNENTVDELNVLGRRRASG